MHGMSSSATHRNVERVVSALTAGGADPARIARMRVLPDAVTTAAAAAAALGVEVGQIANSLVFEMVTRADRAPLLVLTSGAHRVDTGKVAALLGADRIRRASPELVREATGQPIGGVAPVGHPAPLRTLVDRALDAYDEIWAAGGIPHAVFPTTFAELVKVTGGEPADVA
jgi:prolyl-tRNA editing enzyme YbaK/EbsC (Cys-tRNA(Pro) deacylase)